jgi:hypothetical protein
MSSYNFLEVKEEAKRILSCGIFSQDKEVICEEGHRNDCSACLAQYYKQAEINLEM